LAVVALFVALDQQEERRWRWGALMVSAVATALAVLTRSPGIFLLPFAALVVFLQWLRSLWQDHAVPSAPVENQGNVKRTTTFLLTCFALWLLVAAVTFVLLWPAMWVAPVTTVREVFSAANDYAEAGHDDPIFFNGLIYNGDPGAAFYPVTLLWRTTPVVWLGLVLALGLLLPAITNRWGQTNSPASAATVRLPRFMRHLYKPTGVFQPSLLLVLFVIGFWLLMNLGAKKFDRYLLPVYPALDLLAGLGVATVGGQLAQRWLPRFKAYGQPAVIAVFVLVQAGLSLPHYPYYLTYYNPVMGGGKAAVNVMQIGRGEGANLAAEYLNQQTASRGQQSATAASAFPNGPFSYFFAGRTVPPTYWPLADYAVLYTQDVQRQMPSARQVAWLAAQEPLTAITLQGIPYARIYDLASAPTPPFVTTWAQAETAQIRLNAYELTAGVVQPDERVHTTLYLENLAAIGENLNVLVRLVGEDGAEIARDEGWPWGA
ncbi:MAG: hypothetical protein KDE58_36315, partial [Caldilineaceae bacterium]|nr:hypothetical protein [Caldilineaceae bacterium]